MGVINDPGSALHRCIACEYRDNAQRRVLLSKFPVVVCDYSNASIVIV